MRARVFEAKLGKAGSFYVVLEAFYDEHCDPREWDGTSEEYLEAWRDGSVSFLSLKVSARLFGTDLGEAWLSGVEYGSFENWSAWDDDIAREVLTEHSWMIDEALADAKREWEMIRNSEFGEFAEEVAVTKKTR
jgi:hypothetical protein